MGKGEGEGERERARALQQRSYAQLALTIKIERSKENQIKDPFYLSSVQRFPHEALNTAVQGKSKVI